MDISELLTRISVLEGKIGINTFNTLSTIGTVNKELSSILLTKGNSTVCLKFSVTLNNVRIPTVYVNLVSDKLLIANISHKQHRQKNHWSVITLTY